MDRTQTEGCAATGSRIGSESRDHLARFLNKEYTEEAYEEDLGFLACRTCFLFTFLPPVWSFLLLSLMWTSLLPKDCCKKSQAKPAIVSTALPR
jgi:hypothetical protein